MSRTADPAGLTHDAFLGGRLKLWQPARGFRAGLDAVMLAASIPARPGQGVLDLGCGVGAASLCLHARVPGLDLVGVELQPAYAALAARNGAEAGARFSVHEAAVEALPRALRAQRFDHVMLNPPFYRQGRGSPARDAGRETALRDGGDLGFWIAAAARRLAPRGTLTAIIGAERLPEVLGALPRALGGVAVKPLQPAAGREASRVLLRAISASRAGFRLLAPLVLHEGTGDGAFTPEAEAVLRAGAPLCDLAGHPRQG